MGFGVGLGVGAGVGFGVGFVVGFAVGFVVGLGVGGRVPLAVTFPISICVVPVPTLFVDFTTNWIVCNCASPNMGIVIEANKPTLKNEFCTQVSTVYINLPIPLIHHPLLGF